MVGLLVHEGRDAGSPVWASAPNVSTDLSLGSLLRGRFAPGRIKIRSLVLGLRLDRDGNLVRTLASHAGGLSAGGAPVVIADGAEINVQQEGRPVLVVKGITARLRAGRRPASPVRGFQ